MAFDQNLPDGAVNIALGDDAIRANNAALEVAVDEEHQFSTGGNQSGTHVFHVDTTTNLNALGDSLEGRLAWSTSEASADYTLMVHNGTIFEPADINPGNVARVDTLNVFTEMNWVDIEDITADIAANQIEMRLDGMAYKKLTASGNLEILPFETTGDQTGDSTTVILEITQSGAGNTITFGSGFVAAFATVPYISEADGDINVLQFTKLSTGDWMVSNFAEVGAI